jgi:hypothetical protein
MRAYWLAGRSEMPNIRVRCSGSGRPVSASCRIRSRRMRSHVVQVEHADLVDPQADVVLQPGGGVAPGGRGELPASGQLLAPPGEQPVDLRRRRRDPQLRLDRGPRPVHLIQRALGHPAGQVVDLGPVPQLQELEVDRQRGRPSGARRRPRVPQRPAEVGVGILRLHLPQRPGEPLPDQVQGPVSLRIVLSASPADALASTNPASTSVSKASISSAPGGSRSSRKSRTGASANPHPQSRLHPASQAITEGDSVSRRVKEIIGAC